MKRFIIFFVSGMFFLWSVNSCTKLRTNIYDRVPVLNFWRTTDEIAAGVAPVYANLRNGIDMFQTYPLLECSTDEVIVPVRGKDWDDRSMWEPLWKHTWTPAHSDLEFFWSYVYTGSSSVNAILKAVNDITPRPANLFSIQAELKTVRAYYYFQALDLFGNVPVDTSYVLSGSKQDTTIERPAVFAFVEKEIKNNISLLSKEVNQKTYGRATQWFAYALLAKLYVNAKVYSGMTRWTDCINACDSVLLSGNYMLEPNFFDNFSIANDKSRENIFAIPFDHVAGLNGFWIQAASLHYDSWKSFGLDGGGANGFCSTKEYLDIFNQNDIRRNTFLVGQQYINENQYANQSGSSDTLFDSDSNLPLFFDPEINVFSLTGSKLDMKGARCSKWEFNKTGGGLMSNDFAIFRLADIILMKAEAQLMSGDMNAALVTLNKNYGSVSIRSRAHMPDFTSAEMNTDGLLAERAREFSWEGWRRNDMIRLGHFTDARIPEKTKDPDDHFKLYPIPEAEIEKNPYLKQNPGYH
ncbi:MAG: RagB/SusD family nutrient uptake outer membrane protein [Bacteroidota bacterium]